MIRARWFHTSPLVPRTLTVRMQRHAFTDERRHGFLVDRSREEYVQARYIEKVTYAETLHDPFGSTSTVQRVAYRQVPFTLYRNELELRDPPRVTTGFFSALQTITDFTITITPVVAPVLAWVDHLQATLTAKIVVDRLQASQLAIAPEVLATILLRGPGDVLAALAAVVADRVVVVDKARLRWYEDGRAVVLHLERTGIASCAAKDTSQLERAHTALRAAIS